MSHIATSWAMKQPNLTPAQFRVLLCMADRHNPDYGCYPSQDKLAHDCNMSRRSVQNKISELIKFGIVKASRRRRKGSLGFAVNRYYFAFEKAFKNV